MRKTKDLARGHWYMILPSLGIDQAFLRNRHGPCPACGGVDRFRFDDKDGAGTYFCNGCGAGDGFSLVQKVFGLEFKDAAKMVDRVLEGRAGEVDTVVERPAPDLTKNKASLERAWKNARTGRPELESYLTGRGLSFVPPSLRYHAGLEFCNAEGEYRGKYPAMLALVLSPEGKAVTVHRTYLADVTPKKKMMPKAADLRGAAIRLFEADQTLGVAEGIETAIAVHEMTGLPMWAAGSAPLMRSMEFPAIVRRVVIYADNDENNTGELAADALARKVRREGRECAIYMPPIAGEDWLDILRRSRQAS